MTRTILAAVAGLLLAAPAATAAPDRTITLTADVLTQKVTGTTATGFNVSYFNETARPAACGKSPENYCDSTLIRLDPLVPATKKTLTVRMDGIQAHSDFDLRLYRSDANGTRGTFQDTTVGERNGPLGAVVSTFAGDFESNTISVKPGQFYLAEIVYFHVVNDKYDLTATLK